jgi:hypothetical protein
VTFPILLRFLWWRGLYPFQIPSPFASLSPPTPAREQILERFLQIPRHVRARCYLHPPSPSPHRPLAPDRARRTTAMEPADDAAVAPAPDSWETADIDVSMSRLILSSRQASSSSDLGHDQDRMPAPPSQQQAPSAPAREDPVAQVDQFLREALEKPRERLSGITILMDSLFPGFLSFCSGSSCLLAGIQYPLSRRNR